MADDLSLEAPVLVWVMKPNGTAAAGYDFVWNWASWELAGRLVAGRCSARAGGTGDATFQLLRMSYWEPTDYRERTLNADNVIPGSYVCITTGKVGDVLHKNSNGDNEINPTAILWIGWLTGYQAEVIAGTTDVMGTAQAYELGHLLDRIQVTGWAQKSVDTNYPSPLNSPPSANLAGPNGHIIGNAYSGSDLNGNSVYLFARIPSDCGNDATAQPATYWTRWRLLRHMLLLCKNAGLPAIALACDDGSQADDPSGSTILAGYLNQVTTTISGTQYPVVEIFNLEGITFKGMLDLLIPRSLGVGWRIDVLSTGWTVSIYSLAEVGNKYGIPANAKSGDIDLTGVDVSKVNIRRSSEDLPDEIVVEGGRVIWIATVSYADANLNKGWTDSQETNYKTGASDADNYPSINSDRIIRNRQVRQGPSLCDVFSRFVIADSNNGDVRVNTDPAQHSAGEFRPLCPEVQFTDSDGTTRTNTTSRTPYLPSAQLVRTLPWPIGLKTDGTDTRDAAAKAMPQYMTAQAFRYDKTASVHQWLDLIANQGTNDAFGVTVELDDHGPAIRITAQPPEGLAKNHWSGAAVAAIDPTSNSRAIDWQLLVVTVAVESDQRIQITKTRPGVVSPRRRLLMRDEKLQCWAAHNGAILAIKKDGTPDKVSISNESHNWAYFLRNDFPMANRRAQQVAAFAFRSRTAVSLETPRPDQKPYYAVVGRMIHNVIEVEASPDSAVVQTLCNTVIEDVTRDFGSAPRLTVSTDLPAMPAFATFSSPSPTMGGSVSTLGEGTTAQTVARSGWQINGLIHETQRIPIVTAKGGSATPYLELRIIDGQTVYNNGGTTYYGVNRAGSTLTSVAAIYDPTVGTTQGTFIAETGIGRAYLIIDGVQQDTPVLVVHDTRDGVPYDLITEDRARVLATASLPLVSDSTQAITAYIPDFP